MAVLMISMLILHVERVDEVAVVPGVGGAVGASEGLLAVELPALAGVAVVSGLEPLRLLLAFGEVAEPDATLLRRLKTGEVQAVLVLVRHEVVLDELEDGHDFLGVFGRRNPTNQFRLLKDLVLQASEHQTSHEEADARSDRRRSDGGDGDEDSECMDESIHATLKLE